jgi:hypothetical protein
LSSNLDPKSRFPWSAWRNDVLVARFVVSGYAAAFLLCARHLRFGVLYGASITHAAMAARNRRSHPMTRSCQASQGKSAWEIEQILGISHNTVASYPENAKQKLGVRTIAQAVARLAAANKKEHN